MKILVVDDDAGLRKSLTLILEDAGHEVVAARDGEEGLVKARESAPDLVLADVRMPGLDGLGFLDTYRESGGPAPVIVMTAYGGIDMAVDAVRRGAADFLAKPFPAEALLLRIEKVVERHRLSAERGELEVEVTRLRDEVTTERRFGELVARSPQMVKALDLATKVARHPTSILLTGPTGSGKELLARLIHRESDRGRGPFVPVNCGAIPEGLLESHFFGYVKGAFSGADSDREGLFEAADGGTLFLDEVGDLPEGLQVKLLRVLQDGEVRRVGDTGTRKVDVRVVAATNRPLERDVADGRFREDLYYRVAVVTVAIPPLRERPEDLPALVQDLFELHRKRLGVKVNGIERDAFEALLRYDWPGNVRELGNAIERALVLTAGPKLSLEDLPEGVRGGTWVPGEPLPRTATGPAPDRGAAFDGAGPGLPSFAPDETDLSVKRRGAALERELIREALRRTDGHRGKAAELLELSDRALRYKIREYGLE